MTILANDKIANGIYKMILSVDTSFISNQGQFINITIDDRYLKRPISISEYNDTTLTIIYKVVGFGTKQLSEKKVNDTIEAIVALGNGFEVVNEKEVLLVGGGVGVPPLYGLSKELISKGIKPKVILGFASKIDVFYEDKFKELGLETYVTTMDGSYGLKGHIGDAIKEYHLDNLYYYSCGPKRMLQTLMELSNAKGQLSFEARMGCSLETKDGYKRICKEGPVINSEEVIW